jgi:hypothetical protein
MGFLWLPGHIIVDNALSPSIKSFFNLADPKERSLLRSVIFDFTNESYQRKNWSTFGASGSTIIKVVVMVSETWMKNATMGTVVMVMVVQKIVYGEDFR